MPKIWVEYDDKEYQLLKLAATIDGSPNLKAWVTRLILDKAQQIVTDFKSQATHAGMPTPPEGEGT